MLFPLTFPFTRCVSPAQSDDVDTPPPLPAGLDPANMLTPFAQIASDMGKSVGVVTTTRITHATPAAVYSATVNRDWEDDSAIPEGCAQIDIADQLVCDHALFHLEADLRWLELTAARLDQLAEEVAR